MHQWRIQECLNGGGGEGVQSKSGGSEACLKSPVGPEQSLDGGRGSEAPGSWHLL
jgi:hypothetical protein